MSSARMIMTLGWVSAANTTTAERSKIMSQQIGCFRRDAKNCTRGACAPPEGEGNPDVLGEGAQHCTRGARAPPEGEGNPDVLGEGAQHCTRGARAPPEGEGNPDVLGEGAQHCTRGACAPLCTSVCNVTPSQAGPVWL